MVFDMNIFAISDLHLSFSSDKPMDVFGAEWENHDQKMKKNWEQSVLPEDIVIIPGDVSWGMKPKDTESDFRWIHELPGMKLFVKGNHDFWWGSIGRVRGMCNASMHILQNDCVTLDGIAFAGSRGWTVVPENSTNAQELKIYRRELMRLEFSLQSAQKLSQGRPIVAMLHFPPFADRKEGSGFTELLEKYGVNTCVYGHLHGEGLRAAFNGEKNGVKYACTSCDGLGFRLLELTEV